MGPEFAALVALHVQGERFDVAAECRRLGESRSTFYKYTARFRAEGVDGFYPLSRRPLTSPTATPASVEEAVVRARKELDDDGWDAGAIAAQEWCFVLRGESARELWERALAPMGLDLLGRVVRHARDHGTLAAPGMWPGIWAPSLGR